MPKTPYFLFKAIRGKRWMWGEPSNQIPQPANRIYGCFSAKPDFIVIRNLQLEKYKFTADFRLSRIYRDQEFLIIYGLKK